MSEHADIEKYFQAPPNPSRCSETISWENAEVQFGRKFPVDFRRCINQYGLGYFSGFLILYSPIDVDEDAEGISIFESKIVESLPGLEHLRREHPDIFPIDFGEDREKLVLFGGTSNGDQLFWLNNSEDSDNWPIYVFDDGMLKFTKFDSGIVAFLLNLVKGKLSYSGFPQEIFSPSVFIPV